MEFRFERLEIPDVVLVESGIAPDHRGYFTELFTGSMFEANGLPRTFVQVNRSYSGPRVLRGLHYQNPPRAMGKLVNVMRGEIFDVAVDIRRGSPTYGRAVAHVLSSDNRRMMWIPRGFAHGFCVIGTEADVVYGIDEEYAPEHDRGILWNDPAVGIDWPITEPVLSEKDAHLPPLARADNRFTYEPQGVAGYGPAPA